MSPVSDYSTMQMRLHLGTKDHMIIKKLSETSPASDYSTMQIRLHLRTKAHMIINNSSGLHLHPTTQPCKYDFTLDKGPCD